MNKKKQSGNFPSAISSSAGQLSTEKSKSISSGRGSSSGSQGPSKQWGNATSGGGRKGENIATKGVYANKQVHYANSSVLGAFMTVEVIDGEMFEGVFTTWSPELDIVLEQCHRVDPQKPSDHIDAESIRAKMVFKANTIVRCFATDVDLDFSTKKGDAFQTDSQISRSNGGSILRKLEQWEPEGDDGMETNESFGLDECPGGGWNAEEMFERNETKYGVTSTYKPSLEGYTTQLSKDKGAEYREREEAASKIAREIEGDTFSKHRIELENGDEEEAFSAVHRSVPNRGSSNDHRYHGRSGGGDFSAGSVDERGKYVPPARRQQHFGNAHKQTSERPYDRQGGQQRHQHAPHSKGTPPPSSGSGGHHHSVRDYQNHRDQQSGQEEYSRSGNGQPTAGGLVESRRSSGGMGAKDSGMGQQQRSIPNHLQGGKNIASDRDFREKDDIRKDSSSLKGTGLNDTGDARKHAIPQSGGAGRGNTGVGQKPRNDIHDLKDFHSKFQLPAPSVPHDNSASPNTKENNESGASPFKASEAANSPQTSAGSKGALKELLSTADSGTSGEAETSSSSLAKKSTLNPNAKEFSFNPNAKPFIPTGAPSPSPSVPNRPPNQRPQNPAGQGNIQMTPGFFQQVFQPGMVHQQQPYVVVHGQGASGGLSQYPGSGASGGPAGVGFPSNVIGSSANGPHQGNPQSQITHQGHPHRFRGSNPLSQQPPPRGSVASEMQPPPPLASAPLNLNPTSHHQGHPPPPPPPTSFVQFQQAGMNVQYTLATPNSLMRLPTPTSLHQPFFATHPHQHGASPSSGTPGQTGAPPSSAGVDAPNSLPHTPGTWGGIPSQHSVAQQSIVNGPSGNQATVSGPTSGGPSTGSLATVPPTPTPPLAAASVQGGTVPSPGPHLMMNIQPPSASGQPQSLPAQFMYPHHPGQIPIQMAPPGHAGSGNSYPMMSPQQAQHHLFTMQQQYMNHPQNLMMHSPATGGPPPPIQGNPPPAGN